MLEKAVQHEPVDGVVYISDNLVFGKCGVSIASVQENHYGLWSCTIVATEGQVLVGTVELVKGTELARPQKSFLFLLMFSHAIRCVHNSG